MSPSILVLTALLSSAATLDECIFPGQKTNEPDYYWRDYLGAVPEDAVTGGYSRTGNVTYIGQTHDPKVHHGVFPGDIHLGRKEIRVWIGRLVIDSAYVRILCSGNKNRFEWKKAHSDDLHLLNDYHLIKGGVITNIVLYIGRATVDDQVKIGHIYPRTHSNKGFWTYGDDGSELHFDNFEILVLPR